jgi:oligoribonuclease NrnB/cAMP/cGMP phosphodiesterase (DHH superfamily)
MTKTLCIAHGSSCIDGFAASWVVHRALQNNVEFVYASYNQDPPDVKDRDVLIVDFSYPRPILEAMARTARSVLVLDHHKSAAEDLAELASPRSNFISWALEINMIETLAGRPALPIQGMTYHVTDEPVRYISSGAPVNLGVLFDMSRSGAGITWDFFNPGVSRPWFIDLVEDYDIWKFTDDRSRPFHAAVTSYPLSFALWDRLYEDNGNIADSGAWFGADLIKEGTGILRKHDLDVQTIIRTTRRTMVIGGVRVPVCNCPPWLASDVGHALTEPQSMTGTSGEFMMAAAFAATYYDRDGRRNFSLRSRPEGADVSKVCALYGGGGHHGAGGFERPQGWEGDK